MTAELTGELILRDTEGGYYLLSPEILNQARVSAGRQAEIEATIGGDTGGFGLPVGGFSLGLLGYEGQPGNQGGQPGQPPGLRGYEGQPGNQGGSQHNP